MEKAGRKPNLFFDSILGIIPIILMFVVVLLLSSLNLDFYLPQNAMNIASQSAAYISLAMGVCITVRAKGPDFSLGTVALLSMLLIASLSSNGVALPLALLTGFAVSGAIGLLNGWLGTKIPAVFATMITGFGFYFVVYHAFGTGEYSAGGALDGIRNYLFPIALVCAITPAFLLICRSRLGKPFAQRKHDTGRFYILPYFMSSLFGCLAGVIWLARVNVALITSVPRVDMEFWIAFLAMCLYASKLWDNKWLPVLASLLVAWLNAAYSNAMSLARLLMTPEFYTWDIFWAILVAAVALRWIYNRYGWGILSNRLAIRRDAGRSI